MWREIIPGLAARSRVIAPDLGGLGDSSRPAGTGARHCPLGSWQRVATDERGGIAEGRGHWIPDERPDWALAQRHDLFGEEPA